MVRAIVCAGLYPHVTRVDTPEQQFIKIEAGSMAVAHNPKDLKLVTKNHGMLYTI
jgi:hypothetical protein